MFFDTDAQKSAPNRRTRFPQKKNERRWNVFLFQNGDYRTPKSLPHKNLLKLVPKSTLKQTKQIFSSINSKCVCGGQHCATTLLTFSSLSISYLRKSKNEDFLCLC